MLFVVVTIHRYRCLPNYDDYHFSNNGHFVKSA